VLDARDKLQDNVGRRMSRDTQRALREAARALDRARDQDSASPHALETWCALVHARWSVVDRFDSDGRSYWIIKPKPPQAYHPRPLTARQREIVALAARGHSNKVIAYELGLAVGTVGNYLMRIQRKLGARSRIALIRMFHRRTSAERATSPDQYPP
jgi:DNA-binding NarL/FixJ family response regulator